jgi:hypothetical protein
MRIRVLPTALLVFVLAASGFASTTVTLVHPDTGEQAVCASPGSSDEAVALLRRLPRPLVFGAAGALEAQLNTNRITVVEYCARRYELANYVRSSAGLVPTKGGKYIDPVHRWSVAYPEFWRPDDTGRGWVKLSRGMAIVGVHTATDVSGKSLDEVADAWLRGWEQHVGTKVEVVARRRLALSGLTAIEVVHHIGSGVVGKSRKIFLVVKDRAFLIDAETYLEAWPIFEADFNHIVDSFRVSD